MPPEIVHAIAQAIPILAWGVALVLFALAWGLMWLFMGKK
jgi:hypothetical protein